MKSFCRMPAILALTCCMLTITAATPTLLAQTAQTAQTDSVTQAQQKLLDAESARFHAQVTGDVAALTRGLADELQYIHQAGMVQTKAEYLHGMEPGKSHYKSIDATDREARIYGQVGVTHGTLSQDAGPGKQSVTRYTGVYILRESRWQLLSWQTTVIAPPQ